jgi:hypothetical protein
MDRYDNKYKERNIVSMNNTERIQTLLPIGSVVMLINTTKALMIYGICQIEKDSGKSYDYLGVLYPEGNVSMDTQFLFNQEDIQQVLFRGYDTPERIRFLVSRKAFYEKKEDEG